VVEVNMSVTDHVNKVAGLAARDLCDQSRQKSVRRNVEGNAQTEIR
jgi:hypothetical protein